MTSTSIDYAKTYFENSKLTEIHGDPAFEPLKLLRNGIKANLTGISLDLGGGVHEHLGLALNDIEYDLIALGTPYICPDHPGATPNIGATQYETLRIREEQKDEIRLFREVTDVEKAVVKQSVEAIEPKYMKTLRERRTNTISRTVAQVLRFF